MNLVVWGAGRDYIRNRHLIAGYKYRLVDAAEEKQGTNIAGVEVESPDILNQIQCEFVLISTNLYYNEIYGILVDQYAVPSPKIIKLEDIEKEILFRSIGRYKREKCGGPRILFGYCFLTYENCRVHDYLLAESLRLRGAEIIPAICGGLQELECSVYGGIWGNDTYEKERKKLNHSHNCAVCKGYDRKVWEDWGGFQTIAAKDFLTGAEKKFVKEYISGLDIDQVSKWKYEHFPVGEWALKTFFNIHLISFKKNWTKEEEAEIRNLANNIMYMCIASQRMVDVVNPEIIYSNDSFYYPYSILEAIAGHNEIPFYNGYGIRKNTYSYAMNAPVVSMPLDSAWKTFSHRELNADENAFIENYISERRYGKDMMINTADPFASVKRVNPASVYGTVKKEKRTALLATNVTWDAAALNKGIVFENIVDWVMHTVEYFANNTDWQLIVRSHPAEVSKIIPEARERISSVVLKKYGNHLPSNIVLVDADAPVSIYDLFGYIDFGIVYTTTAGLEMCCNGIPTVTVAQAPYRGKGFTFDPVNVEEYEMQLGNLMANNVPESELETIRKQAKKFFLLYYFIYMLPNPFHEYTYENGVKLKIRNAEALLSGENMIWNYICDSILEKKAVLSEDRFPPYVLEV